MAGEPVSERKDVAVPALSPADREHYVRLLVEVHGLERDAVSAMGDEEILRVVRTKQEESIAAVRNPNAFWLLKSMPAPAAPKTVTSKRWGAVVVVVLFAALLSFGLAMLLWALLK